MICSDQCKGKLTEQDITVKVAPARDVTRCPVGKDLSSLWKTSHTDAVIHDGALIQFQQGKVVSARADVRIRLSLIESISLA